MRAVPWLGLLLCAAACSSPSGSQPDVGATPAPLAAPTPMAAPRAFARQDVPLARVLARARASGRPALLLFRTDWCGYCQRLERETLPDARVRAEAQAWTTMAYDADRGEGKALAARYGVRGFPTLVKVDGSGNRLDRWAGFNEPAIYAAILRQMRTGR